MKFFKLATALVSILVSMSAFAEGLTKNIETVLNPPKVNEVFVPPGFDDMDDAEITYVNNSGTNCFLKSFSFQDIDKVNKVIRISNMSMVLKSDFCTYTSGSSPTTVILGELPAGEYRLDFETEKGKFEPYSKINIAKSKNDQKDDYTYANLDINELTVTVNRETQVIEVVLPGQFPSSCFKFQEARVIDNRSENVIEILPIIEVLKGSCAQTIVPFKETVKIPYTESGIKKLVHIRSANGVAIDRVISL
jgi:hypothetical protein